jgi:hypothetical protein
MCTMVNRRMAGQLATAFCGAVILRGSVWPGSAQTQSCPTPAIPNEILGVRIPDSDLARAAVMLAQAESPGFLFHHCMRTFVLAGLFARHEGWKYDEELVFVASALHDLGLLEKYESANMPFEKAGAFYAQFFVAKGGFTPDRADRVWKGIAWHAGQAGSAIPDIRLIQEGAALDVFGGEDFDKIVPVEVRPTILAAFPRCGFKLAFKAALAAHATRQPDHATWTAQFAHEPPSDMVLAVLNSRWPE